MNPESKKKRNKIIRNTLFVLLNIAVFAYAAYTEYKRGGDMRAIFTPDIVWKYAAGVVLCFVLAVGADAFKYHILLSELCGIKRFRTSLTVSLIGKYYDNITPSGIGGQPFQIYYLRRRGVPGGADSAIPVATFLSMQTSFCVLAAVALIIKPSLMESPGMKLAAYIGFFCYMFLPVVLILFSAFPSFAGRTVAFFIKILSRMKIIKDTDSANVKVENYLSEYRSCLAFFKKKAYLLVILFFVSLLYQIAVCSLPFFAIMTFGESVSYLDTVILTLFVYLTVTFIPTPGNSGAAESSFFTLFSGVMQSNVFAATLLWRFGSYYIYLIIGFLIHIFGKPMRKDGEADADKDKSS